MTRRRHQIMLDQEVGEALERLAPQGTKSALVAEALKLWLARDQDLLSRPVIDPVLRVRLDQDSRRMGRIERDLMILIETIGLFIRYQLSITAPLSPDDHAAARALGRLRYGRFIDRVGRMLGQSGSLHRRLIDRMEQAALQTQSRKPARGKDCGGDQGSGGDLGSAGHQVSAGHQASAGDQGSHGGDAGGGVDPGAPGNPGSDAKASSDDKAGPDAKAGPDGGSVCDDNPALDHMQAADRRHGRPAEAGGGAVS